jgi:AcrR family transcriptional regulator
LDALQRELKSFDWSGITAGQRQILEAFLQVATSAGFASVTMRAIGKQLDVSAAALYAHFPGGRDEIVTEALRYHYSGWADVVVTALQGVDDPDDFFATLIEVHVRTQLQRVDNDMFDLLMAVDRLAQVLPDQARNEANRLVQRHRALLVGVARDLGYEHDVERLAALVTSMLDGARSWSAWDGDDVTLADVTRIAVAASRSMFDALSIAQARTRP